MPSKNNLNVYEQVEEKKPKLKLIHPKGEKIVILNEKRDKELMEVKSMFTIDKVLEKSVPFSKVCFHNGTIGWVTTNYIREV